MHYVQLITVQIHEDESSVGLILEKSGGDEIKQIYLTEYSNLTGITSRANNFRSIWLRN